MNLLQKLSKLKKSKKKLIFGFSIAILVLAIFLLVGTVVEDVAPYVTGKPIEVKNEIILFEGKDCDHCEKVNKFIINNKVDQKVEFEVIEVFENTENAQLLIAKARICGLETSQIGVPFLWDNGRCILGDVDVINFFREKITKNP